MLSDVDIANYSARPDLLEDHIIAVTGAGDGVGRAAARAFAAHGATVILIGRSLDKLETVYDAIESSGGLRPAIYVIDFSVAGEQDYQDMADRMAQEFGRLDGLLNNAGILGQHTPLSQYRLDVWQNVLQVNLTSQFTITKALLPLLEKSTAASLLFTSSGVGRKGRAYWGVYAVSKFGMEGLMQVWADELEEVTNIRVNCINPGPTRTAMRAMAYPAENPATLKTPEDIMRAYLYLMGPDSLAVNGRSIDAQLK